ncbi:MAG TPA: GNAT family N-acetyltransferase [Chloroflexia bacterium]|jgi:GNAT superfamily N-acetyltransferase|nr:GNAT family N-acetyltransferase [Chloroflexia bacterium]
MALATWWRGDPLPTLAPLPEFHVEASRDAALIGQVGGLTAAQAQRRLDQGHQPYLAYIGAAPAGYGWLAQQEAEIGELGLRFALPPADRYLWDFATLPAWQGYGIYPRLLQHILRQQALPVERVWIIYAPENTPSGAGMHKAGLLPAGQLSFGSDGAVGLAVIGAPQRAQAGADLLGVPIIETVLAPCWSCGSATPALVSPGDAAGCWPPLRPTTTRCTCAVALKPGKTPAGSYRNHNLEDATSKQGETAA